jgi:hypothetical protein
MPLLPPSQYSHIVMSLLAELVVFSPAALPSNGSSSKSRTSNM